MLLFTSWTKIVSFFLTALFPFHYSLSSSFIKASFKSMLEIPLNKDLVFADLQWKGWCILWHFKITRIRGSFFFNLSTSFILCLHSTADWPPLWGQLSSSHWMLQMNTKTGLTEKREIRNQKKKKEYQIQNYIHKQFLFLSPKKENKNQAWKRQCSGNPNWHFPKSRRRGSSLSCTHMRDLPGVMLLWMPAVSQGSQHTVFQSCWAAA